MDNERRMLMIIFMYFEDYDHDHKPIVMNVNTVN